MIRAIAKICKVFICLMVTGKIAVAMVEQKDVTTYINNQTNTLEVKMSFGEAFASKSSILKVLENKTIFHIDLVYTSYHESETFDQTALNNRRMETLKKLIPKVSVDNPDWTYFRQTGAQTKAEAKTYFHGFVIHYGESMNSGNQQDFFADLGVPFSTVAINNQEGALIKYYSGTHIEMPIDAVAYPNGEIVQGFYQLYYREFRNQAEIALSGIPMTYHESGTEERFNSAGMYEIRAFKDSVELILVKPSTVHFQCTALLPDVSFFQLDEQDEWHKKHAINLGSTSDEETSGDAGFNLFSSTTTTTMRIPVRDIASRQIAVRDYRPESTIDQGAYQGYTFIKEQMAINKNQFYVSMNKAAWEIFESRNRKNNPLNQWVEAPEEKHSSVLVFKDSIELFIEVVMAQKMADLTRTEDKGVVFYKSNFPINSQGQLVVVVDGGIPSSPGLVRGLSSPSFGVYNCDQTDRIPNPIAFSPVYFDKNSGVKIENLQVTCVIDLAINASLSYHPNHLFCNGDKNSKLLLFDNSRNIYLLHESDLASVDLSQQQVELRMTNITSQVKNSNDLKRILEI